MRKLKVTISVFMSALFVMVGILGGITTKAAVVAKPVINYIGVDHTPLLVGDTEKFTLTSKYTGNVQYRAFISDGKTSKELTKGYAVAINANTPYVLPETSKFKLGSYKLTVWVKKVGVTPKAGYDSIYTYAFKCEAKVSTRVYTNGKANVAISGLTVKFNGITSIGGIKGPYLYKLNIYNPLTGLSVIGTSKYAATPSYTFSKAGTYVVFAYVNTASSKTWKSYLAGKTTGISEGTKTFVVTVKSPVVVKPIISVFNTTVKKALFGSAVNVTLTADGIKNFSTVTKYKILDGTYPISAVAKIGTATTIFPERAAGYKVNIVLMDESNKEIRTIEVILGQSGKI